MTILSFRTSNITKGFHEFLHYVKTIIDEEPRLLTYESHVQHVLALSSILLLKNHAAPIVTFTSS
ncbi:hypothetical protein BD770DRAFT_401524 [Pilaira anomala]|nr:hypothetical protein BD770DRAFT_401524 [Pilaira anomala]